MPPQQEASVKIPLGYYTMANQPKIFSEVIGLYMRSPDYTGLADSTRVGYGRSLLLASKALGHLPVTVIGPPEVQEFLEGFAAVGHFGSQQAAKVALGAVERYAIVRRYLIHPITLGTRIEKPDSGHQPWTDEQVRIAERFARPDMSRLVTLAVNTGQRGSDLFRMRWSDIESIEDRPGINVTQRKTGLKIWIPITQDLQYALSTWEKKPTQILLKPTGEPWGSRQQLSEAWTRERDSNPNLYPCADLVLHGLRATAVVRLRRAGATTPQIVDMVGLSAPMVERYSRFANQKQSALAAVLHLDRRTGPEQEQQKVGFQGDKS